MPLVNITLTSHTENHELVTPKEHKENCWKMLGIMSFCNGIAIGAENHENHMKLCFICVWSFDPSCR